MTEHQKTLLSAWIVARDAHLQHVKAGTPADKDGLVAFTAGWYSALKFIELDLDEVRRNLREALGELE